MKLALYPPVRGHFRYRDLARSLRMKNWREILANEWQAQSVWGFGSGRVAFFEFLKALHQKFPARNEVIIPAYTCSTMATGILAAGLVPVLVDLETESANVDIRKLAASLGERTLAVVATHLYGAADPVDQIRKLILDPEICLIEDLSISLGNKLADKRLGMFSDVLFYSCGSGKVVPSMGGGILVVRNLNFDCLKKEEGWSLPAPNVVLKLLAYPLIVSKLGFGILQSSPLRIEDACDASIYPSDRAWSKLQARFSTSLLQSLPETIELRRKISSQLKELVEKSKCKNLMVYGNETPAYLRFPILASSASERTRLVSTLRSQGFHASLGFNFVRPFLDLKKHPVSADFCERLFTLPCYPAISNYFSALEKIL